MTDYLFSRKSGILLHPSCLPGIQGIGTLGKEAKSFVDFLLRSGQSLWQLCPLGPTGYGDSPYQCFSAFAGNPLLIDLESLVQSGLLTASDLIPFTRLKTSEVDFGALIPLKREALQKAFARYRAILSTPRGKDIEVRFEAFVRREKSWLKEYSLFMALKQHFGGVSWCDWPLEVKRRDAKALAGLVDTLRSEIEIQEFMQFLFFEQFLELKAYANQRGVQIIGDMPIFVAFDSADVWSRQDLFLLDEKLLPSHVAGVPPDYFSATGQLWGNPLYNWPALEREGFRWWIDVIASKLKMYDFLRIDHFRGFASFWAVPFGEKTAIKGEWLPAPGKELFTAVKKALGKAPIIAEDLGLITPDVVDLIQHCKFPGMKILQFAFDSGEESDHLPHIFTRNQIVYTGTHDNDPLHAWLEKAKPADKEHATKYLGCRNEKQIHWDFIRAAMASVAVFSIFPLQDVLGLGAESRMNVPGTLGGNWKWRFDRKLLRADTSNRLRELTMLYGRV